MILTSAIRAALLEWLEDATSMTCIYADQAGPRPATTYITLKLLGIRNVGWDDRRDIDNVGIQDMLGDRIVTASINALGNDAFDSTRLVCNALQKETVRDKLKLAGLTPRRVGALDDLTTLLDTEWEPRFHFDADFGFVDEYTDDVGLIEHLEATETYTNGITHIDTWTVD